MLKKEYIENVCNYVIESEAEDFEENPSLYHVYYEAYIVLYGLDSGNEMLAEAIKQRNKGE